jgi:very-short-patch-repair endonuclease
MSIPIYTVFARALRKRQTRAEKIMWTILRNRRFHGYKFLRQYPIIIESSENQKIFYIADFYCYELKLVVEIDGDIHLNQKEYDKQRDNAMGSLGLQVLRISNDIVEKNYREAMKLIEKFLPDSPDPSLQSRQGSG